MKLTETLNASLRVMSLLSFSKVETSQQYVNMNVTSLLSRSGNLYNFKYDLLYFSIQFLGI